MPKPVVPEAARRRRRPTKNGVVLSADLIVQTALRMLREHGPAGLSVRRLGMALGADPSTLYRYFAGIDDLTLAIGDMLIGRAMTGWQPTGDWRADLRDLGMRIYGAYLEHPQAAVLTASRITGKSHEIAADEAILGLLRGAGFPDREAVRVYHAFIDMTLAFAALDAATVALPEHVRKADEEIWQATYARLSPATHPNIAAVAPLLVADMNNSAYPAALDMLLDNAQSRLAARRGTGPGR
ncbi:TetR family transcriptional regulator [Microbispora rosea subsp. aerata]|nr:TetR/AcrR family transcriptional regulator [Microbispora rosea]GGO28520.1 TetR family transcriptional regulator [Microbispora rosea subsp. aerata]GIH58891.1 TetR family transcriptional regulator [Microbispora rosea subsp. aerata]GLJ87235.1 TetR family transcriptional regulator [Microbispora rosea subsp. aerata]